MLESYIVQILIASPPSACVALRAVSDHWVSLLSSLYASGRVSDQRRVGPSVSRITRCWTSDQSSARFQPLQDDDCLVPSFDSFRHSRRPRVALIIISAAKSRLAKEGHSLRRTIDAKYFGKEASWGLWSTSWIGGRGSRPFTSSLSLGVVSGC